MPLHPTPLHQLRAPSAGHDLPLLIVIPADGVQCEDDEVLGISLLRFSAYRDWAGIPSTDNTVTFTTSLDRRASYISPGNPTNSQIALQLSNNTLSISVTYDSPSNTLIFTCPNSMHLTCSPTLGTTLGFPTGISGNSTVLQSATLRPPQLDQVVLHLEGIAPYADRPNMESTHWHDETFHDAVCVCCRWRALHAYQIRERL